MIIVITGATSTGKSSLALRLAHALNGEIINADASQVYQELNIGTAKLKAPELAGIPHHVYDFIPPNEAYSVAVYQKAAREAIREIQNRGKQVIMVGGTGLYLKATLYDFIFPNLDEANRKDYSNFSNEDLFALLKKVDVEAAKNIHPNNRRRIEQALIIYDSLGKNKTSLIEEQQKVLLYPTLFVAIDLPRETIYALSDARVITMLEEGLIKEVTALLTKYGPNVRSLQAIGYKEVISYLNKEISYQDMVNLIQKNTRHYIKRQYAYFRHQLPVKFLPTQEEAYNYVIDALKENK